MSIPSTLGFPKSACFTELDDHRLLAEIASASAAISSNTSSGISVVPNPVTTYGARSIILDNDLGSDIDDAIDMGMLHALADRGEIQIIGTFGCNFHPEIAPANEAINIFYGRDSIPIGTCKDGGFSPGLDFYGQWIVDNYTNSLSTGNNAPDAVTLYRQLLVAQPDASVRVVFTGQMRNLFNVFNSPADSISPLTGAALLLKKVAEFIIVAGTYPNSGGSPEYNFSSDLVGCAIINQMTNYPLVFSGTEVGGSVLTGTNIPLTQSKHNPVSGAVTKRFLETTSTSRSGWGQCGLLYAARGLSYRGTTYYNTVSGVNSLNTSTGGNTFTAGTGTQKYIVKVASDATLTAAINALVESPPVFAVANRFSEGKGTADTFIDNAAISDQSQKYRLYTISEGIVDIGKSRFYAVYPIVGAAAAPHAINLIDVNAHLITWHGTLTQSAAGVKSNGTTGYGSIDITPATLGSTGGFSCDLRDAVTENGQLAMMGSDDGATSYWLLATWQNFTSDRTIYGAVGNPAQRNTQANVAGFYTGIRSSSVLLRLFQDATVIATNTTSDSTSPGVLPFFILASNDATVPGGYMNHNCAFFAFHQALSTNEVSLLNKSVRLMNSGR